ncbi:hypothetical protein GCK32_022637, partial [Trichostrongylus colubriformis]
RLSTAPPAISQVIVPTTKTYPMARASSSTFAGQRQYLMPMTQAGPSRTVPVVTSRVQNQTPIHQSSAMVSHQGPPTLVPVMMDDAPPRLDQRM